MTIRRDCYDDGGGFTPRESTQPTASTAMEGNHLSLSREGEDLHSFSPSFEVLADILSEIIFQTDAEGNLTFMNQAGLQAFFIARPDLSTPIRPESLFAPEDRERLQQGLKRCLEGHPEAQEEYRIMKKDGRMCQASVLGKPLVNNNTCVGSIFVVTERSHGKEGEDLLPRDHDHLMNGNIHLQPNAREKTMFGDIIGKSPSMQEVFDFIRKAAANQANVIIYGESGTGKELVARAIHGISDRSASNFITVNCGAIPENILESEFFGYKKGAFTGAHANKPGYLDYADGGTLFLDEVGEIGLNMQVKLLRAIEGGGYMPVGSNQIKKSDVRIVAATNRNLKELVKLGQMREDFFYRIHILPIYLPALRERKEDLPLLVDHFMHIYSTHRHPLPGKVMQALNGYDWPGNVRELQNVLHRYLTLKKLDFMGNPPIIQTQGDPPAHPLEGAGTGMQSTIESLEKELIQKTLLRCRWHRGRAAQALDINRKTLFLKMKKYGLVKP